MRFRRLWIIAIGALAVLSSNPLLAATSDDAKCALPEHLENELASRFPEAHVVALSDLGNDDKALFAKDHGAICPGVSSLDFYGDGRPAIAISLVPNVTHGKKALLVVAHQVSDKWTVARIDTADLPAPVVWSDKPGEYTDVYGKRKIRATRPVIVWCAYESWAIVYAWSGSVVSKIWIAD
jgi:hypothetical protein